MVEKTKPHLVVIAGRPVAVTKQRESKLDAARRRYGKPFAFESGAKFNWSSDPTVLTDWLQRRIFERTTSSSGKERQ